MTEYRRAKDEGASYFFTVNCAERHGNQLLVEHVDLLRQVFLKVKKGHLFKINAIVVLPDHLHCIWTLTPSDADYKTRWSLIKAGFSRGIPARRKTFPESPEKGRAWNLATPILGTPDSR